MDLSPIMSFLNSFISIINSFVLWIANALTAILWGSLYIIMDGLLTVIVGIVGLIDVSTIVTSLASSWGIVPPVVIWFINQCGFPQAVALIAYAYGIRMLLNLIPAEFTRI
jgi:hypothetical protein